VSAKPTPATHVPSDPSDTRRRATLTVRVMAMVGNEEPDAALSILVTALKLLGQEFGVSEEDVASLIPDCEPHLRRKGMAS